MADKNKLSYAQLLKANDVIISRLEKGKVKPEEAILLIKQAGANLRLAEKSLTATDKRDTKKEDDQVIRLHHVKKLNIEDIPVDQRTGVVEWDNIKKNFGTKKVLKGLSAKFEPGKVYGFLGNNGAGKTTMMRILFNMEAPTSGNITYNVKNLDKDGKIVEKKLKHGEIDYSDWFYFTETDAVPTNYTVHNYLQELAFLYDMPQAEFSYREREIMTFLDVNFKFNVKIASLSSGQQKIVSCIALLLIKPNVVFLDEPTANMDVWNQKVIMKIIEKLKNDNRIIVITTHLLKEIRDTLTDVVIVDEGLVTYQGKLKKNEDLYKLFKEHTTDTTEEDFKDVDKEPENGKKKKKIKKDYGHNSFDRKAIGVYLSD